MTLKQMVEIVRLPFPALSRTQVVFELNNAQREFCARTRVLSTSVDLTRTDDYLSTDVDGEESWQLPVDVFEIIAIDELYRDSYEIWDEELLFNPFGERFANLHMRYSSIPAVMASDDDIPSIPQEFHEALLGIVMAKLYRKSGDMQNAMAELARVRELEAAAKRHTNTYRYRNTAAELSSGVTAQKVAYGSRSLTRGVNTITMTRSFTSATSYVVMLNGNGVEVSEYDPNENKDQRTSSSFKVISADDNPNFEYYATGS